MKNFKNNKNNNNLNANVPTQKEDNNEFGYMHLDSDIINNKDIKAKKSDR